MLLKLRSDRDVTLGGYSGSLDDPEGGHIYTGQKLVS